MDVGMALYESASHSKDTGASQGSMPVSAQGLTPMSQCLEHLCKQPTPAAHYWQFKSAPIQQKLKVGSNPKWGA